ncbi:Xaa-Pro peptidase family protein [Alkalihalobacillus sp. AL-G]|uniref:M24 family metallopeptidase n=1 Tax=Alkalihalobacillus sp. AL-G TaxID=2926399 RepID=UPI00272BA293|nr:Xaa-Pro peptidase family protein [Alkalihalobacillus sp. AL-G]WLD92534.1 Xaa-Pro peptidase family protein [Alkalihalobacillus sp. AL-G]
MDRGNPQIVKEKLSKAVELLNEKNIDTWLVLSRQGSDPCLPFVSGVDSEQTSAIFINRNGRHEAIASETDFDSYCATQLFSVVHRYEDTMDTVFNDVFNLINPEKLALNISLHDHLCDGLTLGMYKWLESVVGSEKLAIIEVSSEPILKELRSIKSPSEIEAVHKAVKNTTDVFNEAFSQMKIGMSEKEIGALFVDGMKKRGVSNGLGDPFDPPLVCIVRCGLAHRKPGDHIVEPGDIVIIDFSLRCNGYVSDIARTCYFLKQDEVHPPDDVQHAFQAAVQAITQSIEVLVPGLKGYEVDAAGRSCIESHGYPTIRHSVGHQVGRATHDGGTILGPRKNPSRPQVEGTIRVGEIYAIEPTVIQDDGLPCILVEENVLVTDDGPVILSERQLELVTIPYRGVN